MSQKIDEYEKLARKHAVKLIQCESVTPDVKKALDYCHRYLAAQGFQCYLLPFGQGEKKIDNLVATIGNGSPHLCFAGHLDTVPPGKLSLWKYPPYSAKIIDGKIFGRGAEDMKGNIAAFLAATKKFLDKTEKFNAKISILLTGDEEDIAENGTRLTIKWMAENKLKPDHAIVGEPSSQKYTGDAIKTGRRGSLNAQIEIAGKQGHVAYEKLAYSPIPPMIHIAKKLIEKKIDDKTKFFQKSKLQITSIETDNKAKNVIPANVKINLNIRFNDNQTAEKLQKWLEKCAGETEKKFHKNITIKIKTQSNAQVFNTTDAEFIKIVQQAVKHVIGEKPALSTSGGTSDARFIKDYCPVVELGLPAETLHQVDENIEIEQLDKLTEIYYRLLHIYFFRVK